MRCDWAESEGKCEGKCEGKRKGEGKREGGGSDLAIRNDKGRESEGR